MRSGHVPLAKRKLAVAGRIGSRALRADAVESITCGWLAFVVVVGLLVQLALGAWVDSVTSLAILWFLIKEAREAWAGEACCDDDLKAHAESWVARRFAGYTVSINVTPGRRISLGPRKDSSGDNRRS